MDVKKFNYMTSNNTSDLVKKIQDALSEIRPFLERDGGNVSLVEITNELDVIVKFHGSCQSCTVNQMTLKSGVEYTIKKYAPEINKVINVE